MPFPALVDEMIRRFVEKVRAFCGGRVLVIRIFGSMARGDFHEGSDLDVFVMVDRRELSLVDAISTAAGRWGTRWRFPSPSRRSSWSESASRN